jgi:PAS domain S-box-containing protein
LIAERTPYIANDAAADPQTDREFCARMGVRSAICTPIPDTQGEVIGFLEIHNKADDTGFTPADQERLMAVCQAVSTAIQNALAYRRILRADEALRASEQRYRDLVENANDVIYTRDLAGNFTSFNKAAERLTGYTREEALRMNFSQLLAPEQRKAGVPAGEGRPPDGGPATHELVIAAKDGRRLTLEVSTRLIYEEGMPVGVQGIARDVTERRRAERSVRQLSGRLLRLQDEERRRIARELHDSTSQSLAALAMSLAQVQESAAALEPPARKALVTSLELAEQSSKEIRTLSYLLHPPLLDELGLTSALKWYAEGFAERSGLVVDLEVCPDLGRLHQELELTLFRIVQESLTNIHRHSGSLRASIRVAPDGGDVRLEVMDQGRGMPSETLQAARAACAGVGVGLAGMRERVSQLGGRLEIESGEGGTTLTAVLPRLQAS